MSRVRDRSRSGEGKSLYWRENGQGGTPTFMLITAPVAEGRKFLLETGRREKAGGHDKGGRLRRETTVTNRRSSRHSKAEEGGSRGRAKQGQRPSGVPRAAWR